jgi:hypothetical protein
VPIPKDDEAKIWARVREQRLPTPLAASIPDDELVEDAGLAEVA